jgi:hypothetical protein
VRYLYQALDALHVVLITTKASNILEDLDTLHLVAKLVPDTCRGTAEDDVVRCCFELVFALDEVVSMGYKEKLALPQIRTFIEMDSHEERIAELVEKNKMKDVAAESKRKQKEIKSTKAMGGMGGGMGGGGSGAPMGRASSSGGGGGGGASPNRPAATEAYVVESKQKKEAAAAKETEQRRRGATGMQLGAKTAGKKDQFLEQLVDEGDMAQEEYAAALTAAPKSAEEAAAALPQVKKEAVHIVVEERLSAVLTNDGALKSFDLAGEFRLTIADPAYERLRIQLAHSDTDMRFTTHPKVNKSAFTELAVIETKQADVVFPINNALGVLKWRLAGKDESLVPLAISCWPSPGAKDTVVNVEYTLNDTARELRGVVVRIPLPGGAVPVVSQVDGTHTFDHKAEQILWHLPLIDKDNATGSLEFTLPAVVDSAALFPIEASFVSASTFSTVAIQGLSVPSGAEVKFSEQRSVQVDKYTIEA